MLIILIYATHPHRFIKILRELKEGKKFNICFIGVVSQEKIGFHGMGGWFLVNILFSKLYERKCIWLM
jgi:hypothetical protein